MDFEELLYKRMRSRSIEDRNHYLERLKSAKESNNYDELSILEYYESMYEDVTKRTIQGFNQQINCGGWALEIDMCLYPTTQKFDNYVSGILNTFDFVRLLGDEPLHEDEYLVLYRFFEYNDNNGRNHGHHFIKINRDGLVDEKCGGDTPRVFSEWDEGFNDSPEAVFAVKKDHDYLFDISFSEYSKLSKSISQGLDFDETAANAIRTKNNSFGYHCRNYRLKKSSDGQVFILNPEGEIIADVLIDGDEVVSVVRAGKEEYVENLEPVKPIIKNGKLVNFKAFEQIKAEEEIEI